jgi:hypothetical protein
VLLFFGHPKTDLGFFERSTANDEQNQQDDNHKRYQPATNVHDKLPFLGIPAFGWMELRV